jgi:ubiquinol-cytochrome c reductase cytochrome b subunit
MALLVLLSILVLTGAVLALGYCPAMDEAYQSVQHITELQTLGWFVRGLHYWSAGIMVVMLFLHFCRQILLGGYKAPREATWLVGVLLLFIVLATSLLGYILRWDERGFYGLRVAVTALHNVPYIGDELVALMLGSSEVSSLTLCHACRPVSAVAVVAGQLSRLPCHSARNDDRGRAQGADRDRRGATRAVSAASRTSGEG